VIIGEQVRKEVLAWKKARKGGKKSNPYLGKGHTRKDLQGGRGGRNKKFWAAKKGGGEIFSGDIVNGNEGENEKIKKNTIEKEKGGPNNGSGQTEISKKAQRRPGVPQKKSS